MQRPVGGVLVVLGTVAALAQQPGLPDTPAPWPPPGVAVPGNGVTPPHLLQEVKPLYTGEAMRQRIQGVVRVGAIIETDGSVGAVQVLQSLDPGLDDEAVKAVRQWKFAPGRARDGSAVRVAVKMQLSFRLRDGTDPAPVSAWPVEFETNPTTSSGRRWIDRSVDVGALRVHVSYPDNWVYQAFADSDARLASLRGALSMRTVTIRKPRAVPQSFDGLMTQQSLDRFVGGVETLELTQGRKIDFGSYGQVMTSSTVWVWMQVHASPSDLPQHPIGARVFSDIRSWLFVTSVEQQMVMVDCTILVPTDATPAQRQAQLEQATAEFAGIMRRLSIGHR